MRGPQGPRRTDCVRRLIAGTIRAQCALFCEAPLTPPTRQPWTNLRPFAVRGPMNDVIVAAAVAAVANFVALGGVPFLLVFGHQKWRTKRSFGEVAQRAGLQLGAPRFIAYSAGVAAVIAVAVVIWPPPVEPFVRQGSPQRAFFGLGLNGPTAALAVLYGVVKTGVPEELLFRGLIAGSLSRRLSIGRANLLQALLFVAPHLAILWIMPEMWFFLPLVFVVALVTGWVRIRSGSIIGPSVIHASANVAMCLSIAARTAT